MVDALECRLQMPLQVIAFCHGGNCYNNGRQGGEYLLLLQGRCTEAARFDAAQVQLETEKSLFLTHAKPFYAISNLRAVQESAPVQRQSADGATSQAASSTPVSTMTAALTLRR